MLTIDITATAAGRLLLAVAAHAGPMAELGRPLLAVGGYGILTELGEATALVSLDHRGACRTVVLPTGLCEVTRWSDGVETSRAVG